MPIYRSELCKRTENLMDISEIRQVDYLADARELREAKKWIAQSRTA